MPPLCSQDKEQTPDDLRSFIFPGPCQPLSHAILCSGHMNLLFAPGKCNPSYLEAFTQVKAPSSQISSTWLTTSQTSLTKTFPTL